MTPATLIRHNRGSFSQGLLDGDIATLVDLYHANGFPDATITSMKLDDYKGKMGDLSVRLDVTEGAQRFINSLVLDGVADADSPVFCVRFWNRPRASPSARARSRRIAIPSSATSSTTAIPTPLSTGRRLPARRLTAWISNSWSSPASGSL